VIGRWGAWDSNERRITMVQEAPLSLSQLSRKQAAIDTRKANGPVPLDALPLPSGFLRAISYSQRRRESRSWRIGRAQ
jgi:hypothetical protein